MSKDDATWLNVAYVCFLVLTGFFAYKAAELVGVQLGWSERFEWYTYVGLLAGIVVGFAATWYLKRDQERHDYLLSAIAELRKVTWPSWNDTKRMTIVVCIVCGIFAVIVGVFDVLWAKALNLLIA
jgi:preprotein translocase SecE subunit